MSLFTAAMVWSRDGAKFTDQQYCRGHRWIFDGGIEITASSSPHVVRWFEHRAGSTNK
ncbi:MAG: hypothetical protein KF851_05160 [Pirellulaceae bacterium]|nr:hypothetical protein [Pirellulaceae bacterium]